MAQQFQVAALDRRCPASAVRIPAFGLLFVGLLASCTNDPYPSADHDKKILYTSFVEAPRTLDPAVAYTTASSVITGNVFDTLVEFHYLKRPYELIPALAEKIPEPERLSDGRIAYRFHIRPGAEYHEDPCFAPNAQINGRRIRPVHAADFAFALMRIADPKVNSPVATSFQAIAGFGAFTERLQKLRETDSGFGDLPAHEQYARAGGIAGAKAVGPRELEIVLDAPDPQILYWFAMPFTAPMPWEAVTYYDGDKGRDRLADHPVGSGPFMLKHYDKQFLMVLERNDAWYGHRNPGAPGATFPSDGDARDIEDGVIDLAYFNRAMPFLERIEFRRERESIPRFNKFLQGYYDSGGILKESFDAVIQNDRLSPEMAARGMRLDKTIEPSIFYIGFNMDDPVVGRAAGERGRKLRQAMSLVIDSEIYLELFANGRGVPAQSPLPPGLFGYDPDYRNQFRLVDVERAKKLLVVAGYRDGVDEKTDEPLKLTFDTGNTTSRAKLRFQFFVNAWRMLGIDVEIAATNYSQFQAKVRRGAYQIFQWGWIADYPDPENLLFLLQTAMARSESSGPNTANFKDPEYDRLFDLMKDRENDERRKEIIAEMRTILERERPWIELSHREAYALSHAWLKNAKPSGLFFEAYKYLDVDTATRDALRREWNRPVLWPLYALFALAIALIAPGIVIFYRERQ